MLIINSEEKQQNMINTWATKNICVSKINSVIPRAFPRIPVYMAIAYLNGTEEPSPWLEGLSVKFLEFKVPRLG